MTYQLTPESFLNDVKDHQLTILREDGVYRHLRFRRPDTGCFGFDLITWPGYLAYSGDMGHFMFTRTNDMLEFFRRNPERLVQIDFRYWAEKCVADDTSGQGIREWDAECFKRAITEERRRLLVRHGRDWNRAQREDFWDDLWLVICAGDYEHHAITAVQEWYYVNPVTRKNIHIETTDFPICKAYTHCFLWCCRAIAWGVSKYDELKARDSKITA